MISGAGVERLAERPGSVKLFSAVLSFFSAPERAVYVPPVEAHQEELEALRRAWELGSIRWELVRSSPLSRRRAVC